ncbi:amidase [Streptomyces avermitilis]|uniref:Amidase n=2 Tax=Streptomyces avermitilis TaxID=33903 RepID=Q82CV6_STRAW|nr:MULTISPECIES: amidase [Streptomyces]KUN51899.1 amidase [Streptomyces avermitilis]MYT00818.1 amidase [Streptomyces sp. SID5469]OOV31024.1 amidase [Streptomyces avermitilis]BAC72944.1 putative amidase [Streptomyces avermitilis MA-4680 = NBRC 14893]GDY65366.1 amidase [Streptomyces avermitilis]
MTELTELTAVQLVDGYRKGEFSPVDAVRATLERAERIQPAVNAFVLPHALDSARAERFPPAAHEALARAAESADRWRRGEPAGLLDGVPVTVKDIILQRGRPTLRGSKAVDPQGAWGEDAPSVARLREHGAVFIGRTTTPEFGWKGVTDSPLTGVTRNPYDTSRTAGGSSGGSAAAVALGAGPLSLGTDGGGSVRIPAGFCGIFALKPTYGRVPLYPASAFGTLAHVGPMTRDAADAALAMDVISGPDARDWSGLGPVGGSFTQALAGGVRGLRVAYSPSLGGQVAVRPEVASAVRRAVQGLAGLGAYVSEADPDLTDPVDAFHVLWFSGAARVTQHFGPQQREVLDPGLREICGIGARFSALDYLAAVDVRMDLGRRMGRFHESYDVLVTPTLPITAFEAGAEVPAGSGLRRWTGWTPFTYPFNMTQQPAATVPVGVDGDGLPVGMQVVAARHRDDLVLRVAHALYEAGVAGIGAPTEV